MTASTRPARRAAPTLRWLGIGLLFLFTLTAIMGYWVFALHPNLIPDSDFARRVYGASFQLFARAHIVVAALVLVVFLARRVGARWVPSFAALALVSFLSEFIGTGYGFPFSGYEYTSLLGYKLGGRVPWVIPVSWFLMALPAWIMANSLFKRAEERWGRVIFAGYLLTAWDLILDPAMSYLTPYWVWENPGPFFGMPWVNLAGWMGTGMVLMGLLEILRVHRWASHLDLDWIVAYYGVVLAMPAGMLAAAGVWSPIGLTGLALLLAWGVSVVKKTKELDPVHPPMALTENRA